MRHPELPEAADLAKAGSVVVTDALQLKSGLAAYIRPTTAHVEFCGRAVTAAVEPGDNRAAYEALDLLQPGDVLVVSCADVHDVAMVGGALAGHCRNLGAVGIVTDGMIRDSVAIARLGIPVWARGIVPNAPQKLAAGRVGLPVNLGGVPISTGDYLVADVDGLTVVPSSPPEGFRERLRFNLERERKAELAVERGERAPAWLRAIREQAST